MRPQLPDASIYHREMTKGERGQNIRRFFFVKCLLKAHSLAAFLKYFDRERTFQNVSQESELECTPAGTSSQQVLREIFVIKMQQHSNQKWSIEYFFVLESKKHHRGTRNPLNITMNCSK